MSNKITPALWFHTKDGKLAEVINYYKCIFANHFKPEKLFSIGKTPSGYTELSKVKIFNVKYSFMSTSKKHNSFNDALSFIIYCKDQKEIDNYWNYFTKEGKEVWCGWCIDKYGLRWQIVPKDLDKILKLPNSSEVMMKQKKIVIADYYRD